MPPAQPHVGIEVHSLWLLRERLQHVGTTPETRPYLLCPSESTGLPVLSLALVAQVIAVSAQKILPRPVQNRHPPATRNLVNHAGADEPGPLSPEVARRPLQRHHFFDGLPLGALSATVAVGEDHLVPKDEATYGAGLPTSPRPRRAKARAWLQQAIAVETSNVEAVALARGGLLVEAIPVATSQ